MREQIKRELAACRAISSDLYVLHHSTKFTREWWEARFSLKERLHEVPSPTSPPQPNIARLLDYYRELVAVAEKASRDDASPDDIRRVLHMRDSKEAELAPIHSEFYLGRQ